MKKPILPKSMGNTILIQEKRSSIIASSGGFPELDTERFKYLEIPKNELEGLNLSFLYIYKNIKLKKDYRKIFKFYFLYVPKILVEVFNSIDIFILGTILLFLSIFVFLITPELIIILNKESDTILLQINNMMKWSMSFILAYYVGVVIPFRIFQIQQKNSVYPKINLNGFVDGDQLTRKERLAISSSIATLSFSYNVLNSYQPRTFKIKLENSGLGNGYNIIVLDEQLNIISDSAYKKDVPKNGSIDLFCLYSLKENESINIYIVFYDLYKNQYVNYFHITPDCTPLYHEFNLDNRPDIYKRIKKKLEKY